MVDSEQPEPLQVQDNIEAGTPRYDKSIVMVGLMGAGKSAIGRRLATHLHMPFVDADTEIEAAAGCTIEEIFKRHGEEAFRDGERRVISRLLEGPPIVLATGGGAFMDESTRAEIARTSISIWLRAELDTLVRRTAKRNNRPLLKNNDPAKTLKDLMVIRHPIYELADIVVESDDTPLEETVNRVCQALAAYSAKTSQNGKT
jgi:shikimate kinase